MTAKERLRELVEALPEERAAEWCARIEGEEGRTASQSRSMKAAAILSILQTAASEDGDGWTPDDFLTSLETNRLSLRVHDRPVAAATVGEIAEYNEMLRDLDSYRPERNLFS